MHPNEMWRKLTRIDGVVMAAVLTAVAVIAIPNLPTGPCFSDSGDLQLGAATLGIMHPPGYVGFASLGYLLKLVPGIDFAYAVTLSCLASGLVALGLCMLIQIRLGVSVWVAGAATLALISHKRVWDALVIPEIYVPTLAFLLGSAYLLLRYTRVGVRRDLFLAVGLFAFALANRPPVLFFLPFFLLAWWPARKKWEPNWNRSARTLGWSALLFVLPVLYSVVFMWVRDRPDVSYNYIEQHNVRMAELPESSDGWRAKLTRIEWQYRGKQFADLMGADWFQVRQKIRWLRHELFLPHQQDVLLLVSLLVLVGLVRAFRTEWPGAIMLLGMIVGSVVFICVYRIHGQAADILPLMFASAVLGGVALQSIQLPDIQPRVRRITEVGCILLFILVAFRARDLVPVLIPSILFGAVTLAMLFSKNASRMSRGIGIGFALLFLLLVLVEMSHLIPVFVAASLLGGIVFARMIPQMQSARVVPAGVGLLAVLVVVLGVQAEYRPQLGLGLDATSFLEELDMETLPPDAVICADWHHATPLWYDRAVLSNRPDVEVMCTDSGQWLERMLEFPNRPKFVVSPSVEADGYRLEPFRNVWTMIPVTQSPDESPLPP